MTYAIIVTYNPEQELMDSQFSSLANQVDGVIYIDNASSIAPLFPEDEKVIVLRNRINEGLAKAQNQGIECAKNKGAEHILLLDQDSELGTGMVSSLLCQLESLQSVGKNVGVICPVKESAFDGSVGLEITSLSYKIQAKQVESTTEVAYSIASGMLIPMSVIRKVGGMNENLFIDGLDLEWCFRATHNGYKIYVTPGARLYHRLGNGKKDRILSHSKMREYYITRNDIYLSKQKHIPLGYRMRKKLTPYARLLISLVRGNFKYVRSELRGIKDGLSL